MFFIPLVLLAKLPLLRFVLKFLKYQILLVGFIEAVSCIPHDHIKKLLKYFIFEIALEIVSIDIMCPQGHEDPVHALTIPEFGVKLMTRASDCNITVKFHQS